MANATPRVFDTDKRIRLGIWGLGRGMSFYSTCAMLNVDVVAGCDYNAHMRKRFLEANPGAFVTAAADEYQAGPREDLAAELYEVERALQAATRRLARTDPVFDVIFVLSAIFIEFIFKDDLWQIGQIETGDNAQICWHR